MTNNERIIALLFERIDALEKEVRNLLSDNSKMFIEKENAKENAAFDSKAEITRLHNLLCKSYEEIEDLNNSLKLRTKENHSLKIKLGRRK